MTESQVICPACSHECASTKDSAPTICPACGLDLIDGKHHNHPATPGIAPDQLQYFEAKDKQLAERLRGIVPEASWHLAVISEILDVEYTRLSNALNETQPVSNRMFNLKRHKSRVDTIKYQYHEFSNCITDIQEALINYMDSNCKFPSAVKFNEFHGLIYKAFDRLSQYHRTVIELKFVRDSVEHGIQGLMIDWVHYVLVSIGGLKKQLDRKRKLDLQQLKIRSVEVTLTPPDLNLLFTKLEQLSDSDSENEPEGE